jgi:hypothetical protein
MGVLVALFSRTLALLGSFLAVTFYVRSIEFVVGCFCVND